MKEECERLKHRQMTVFRLTKQASSELNQPNYDYLINSLCIFRITSEYKEEALQRKYEMLRLGSGLCSEQLDNRNTDEKDTEMTAGRKIFALCKISSAKKFFSEVVYLFDEKP